MVDPNHSLYLTARSPMYLVVCVQLPEQETIWLDRGKRNKLRVQTLNACSSSTRTDLALVLQFYRPLSACQNGRIVVRPAASSASRPVCGAIRYYDGEKWTGPQDGLILRCDGAQLSGGALLPMLVVHIYELWVNQDAHAMRFSDPFQSLGTCN